VPQPQWGKPSLDGGDLHDRASLQHVRAPAEPQAEEPCGTRRL